jgi:hypothetical protein
MLEFTRKAALVLALICLALAAWTLRGVLMTLFGAFILANGMSLAEELSRTKRAFDTRSRRGLS